jgi:hypothetical protein
MHAACRQNHDENATYIELPQIEKTKEIAVSKATLPSHRRLHVSGYTPLVSHRTPGASRHDPL